MTGSCEGEGLLVSASAYHAEDGPLNAGLLHSKCEKKNDTQTGVHLIEGVRLIWGPLNAGLTIWPFSTLVGAVPGARGTRELELEGCSSLETVGLLGL